MSDLVAVPLCIFTRQGTILALVWGLFLPTQRESIITVLYLGSILLSSSFPLTPNFLSNYGLANILLSVFSFCCISESSNFSMCWGCSAICDLLFCTHWSAAYPLRPAPVLRSYMLFLSRWLANYFQICWGVRLPRSMPGPMVAPEELQCLWLGPTGMWGLSIFSGTSLGLDAPV